MIKVILTHTRETSKYYVFNNDGGPNSPCFGQIYIHKKEIPDGVLVGCQIEATIVPVNPAEEPVLVPQPQPQKPRGVYVNDEYIGPFTGGDPF